MLFPRVVLHTVGTALAAVREFCAKYIGFAKS